MRRVFDHAPTFGGLAALIVAFFGPVLLRGHQFAYRDAAHFYYPLYQRVQQEWHAGRVPLWEMEENAGMPLLGNPAAAVLYPGKLVYALFSYPWAARWYIVVHVVLAFAGQRALLRHWGVERPGAAIGAFSYAFGGPVLFQYCNVIYLVGAAWAPWGIRAADRLVRQEGRWALPELAGVLALQVLGGDPEAAYLTTACAGGYALAIARAGRGAPRPRRRTLRALILVLLLTTAWAAAVLTAAYLLRRGAAPRPGPSALGVVARRGLVPAAWAVIGTGLAWRWRRRQGMPPAGRALVAVLGASALALALAAAQLLPVLEFVAGSVRARDESPQDIYLSSIEPYRAVELVWPNVFGTILGANRYWLPLVPPKHSPQLWSPSLYLGGLALVLSLGAAGFRGVPPWRGWMTAIALLSFLAAMGEYGSPLWWARSMPAGVARLGGHDLHNGHDPPRVDASLRDGDGGFYWLLKGALPGFGLFRYPGKLLTFTCLAISALAGMGWDRVASGGTEVRRANACAAVLLAATLAALGGLALGHARLAALLASRAAGGSGQLGPLDLPGALAELRGALVHGAVLLALALALIRTAHRFPRIAGALAITLVALDLAVANGRLVVTLPQAVFDAHPELLGVIDRAEAADPAPGPFRVHRLPRWDPIGWYLSGSPDRSRDLVEWRRRTLEPKYGLPYGVDYTLTEGTTELDDYRRFFRPIGRVITPRLARFLRAAPGEPFVYYPRRAFDLWNTRYFILPAYPRWSEERRGIAAFLTSVAPVAPDPMPVGKDWVEGEDWQVLRNLAALPRAWVVHQARRVSPGRGGGSRARADALEEIVYPGDEHWTEPGRPVYDPRETAWVESDDLSPLAVYLAGGRPTPAEAVAVRYHGPQRVELEARLESPGLVVLADVDYPGWRLTIDGRPAPILRVNRRMRGAAVAAGLHRLVYTYEPWSFRAGLAVTAAALVATWILGLRDRQRPARRIA